MFDLKILLTDRCLVERIKCSILVVEIEFLEQRRQSLLVRGLPLLTAYLAGELTTPTGAWLLGEHYGTYLLETLHSFSR